MSSRRTSARIREIPEHKRPYYGQRGKRKLSEEEDEVIEKKIPRKNRKTTTETTMEIREPKNCTSIASTSTIHVAEENETDQIENLKRVKATLKLFNLLYLRFVKEEDLRAIKSREVESGKKPSRRPDLKAMEKMRKDNEFLHLDKILGSVPGIKVGFQFFSRTEMVTVGMHTQWISGIDTICRSKGHKDEKYKGYSLPLAISIVLSGQYEDDVDNSDEIVYTGQGGNDLLGNKQQIKDQVMISGNLGLKNSMIHSVPVRVVRGHDCKNSYTNKVYTYDGLYKVVEFWAAQGAAGFTIFKYRLKRLPGQPELFTNEVRFVRGKGLKAQSEIPGLVCKDISNGLEAIPIPVTNIIDDPPIAIEGFTYMTASEIACNIEIPPNARGCKCKGNCTDPDICGCARLNGSDFPYVKVTREGVGRLIEPKDIVFECGPNCGCGSECVNRTSQNGINYRLEIYRTFDKGWAVRSWDYIPPGAMVCEYIGVLRKSDDLENATSNEYIFEIDCLQTINGIGGRERRLGDVTLLGNHVFGSDKVSESAQYCLDSGSKGNVARFINHSCEPNLFVQCILSTHHDITLARIVLFAAETIVPLQELSYDYGYELDSVVDSDGKIKRLACHCNANGCRGRLY